MVLKRSFKEVLHFIRNPRRIYAAIWEELEELDERLSDDGETIVTSVASGPGYTQNQLNQAFGIANEIPLGFAEKFVGIYTNTNDNKKYLVTLSEGEYKGISFNTIS
ncbi:hypothetical protein SDC9_30519 [bioreactor metagenome]|uniref:Uncharacterized protein n=1 Tax=bioreactor metagenome TaxID=1076179 RepID=A0A644V028_9ZZZZ|nr:hypothetical protein [Methanobrevibacter sp.]MEA4957548.1 hypothetical protein [Methanobrevibacter sp.]